MLKTVIFLRDVDGGDGDRSICYSLVCMGSDFGPVNFGIAVKQVLTH